MRRARTSRPNGKGKLRWEAFADMADRGEIIISFIGEPNQMVAVISTPGERDRYLGGPGVKKLAAHKRKLARKNSHHDTLTKYDSEDARLVMWEHRQGQRGTTYGLPGTGTRKFYDHGPKSRAEIGEFIDLLGPRRILIMDKHGTEYDTRVYLDDYRKRR